MQITRPQSPEDRELESKHSTLTAVVAFVQFNDGQARYFTIRRDWNSSYSIGQQLASHEQMFCSLTSDEQTQLANAFATVLLASPTAEDARKNLKWTLPEANQQTA